MSAGRKSTRAVARRRSRNGAPPGVRGGATPTRRKPPTTRAKAQGPDIGRAIGDAAKGVGDAIGRIFPAGRGNAISDAMKVGQDPNNPLKRILR